MLTRYNQLSLTSLLFSAPQAAELLKLFKITKVFKLHKWVKIIKMIRMIWAIRDIIRAIRAPRALHHFLPSLFDDFGISKRNMFMVTFKRLMFSSFGSGASMDGLTELCSQGTNYFNSYSAVTLAMWHCGLL